MNPFNASLSTPYTRRNAQNKVVTAIGILAILFLSSLAVTALNKTVSVANQSLGSHGTGVLITDSMNPFKNGIITGTGLNTRVNVALLAQDVEAYINTIAQKISPGSEPFKLPADIQSKIDSSASVNPFSDSDSASAPLTVNTLAIVAPNVPLPPLRWN